jgi:glycerate-2-kinase
MPHNCFQPGGPSVGTGRENDNNSTEFFEKLRDLLVPGPILTNVNDFRAILVDSQ